MRFFSRASWFLLALLLIGAAWCIRPLADTDILWHLRAGQWMIEHGTVIRHDIFSATRCGCEWISVPWLYQIMLVHLLMPWDLMPCGARCPMPNWLGPTLWQMAMLLVVIVQTSLLVWLYRRENSRWNWRWPQLSVTAALAVLLMLRLIQMRINCRPEWFTYLFIGTDLILLTLATRRRNDDSLPPIWPLVLLPLVQILWANTHGAFIIGPVIIATFAAAAWMQAIVAPQAGLLAKRLALVALLASLACLVNPYGIKGALYPLHLFNVLTDPLYSQSISEGHPVQLITAPESGGLGWWLVVCWIFAGLGLLGRLLEGAQNGRLEKSAIFLGKTRLSPTLAGMWRMATDEIGLGFLGVCVMLGYLSLSAIRNVPLLALVVVPFVANGFEYSADGFAGALGAAWARLRGRTTGAADAVNILHGRTTRMVLNIALALTLAWCYREIISERFYASLGWRTRVAVGFSSHEHPLAAAGFLSQNRAAFPTNMTVCGDTRSANTLLFRFGPAWKTYFDGRHAEIYDPVTFRRAVNARTNTDLFLSEAQKYRIGVVCLALADLGENRSPLAEFLYGRTNDWRLVYLDDCAVVFAATNTTDAAFLKSYQMPPPPDDAIAQRAAFAAWLKVQGRASLAALDDQNNVELSHSTAARGLMNVMQLGGLFAPKPQTSALRLCRVAAFLDHLGWRVVADDVYKTAVADSTGIDEKRATLPRAIKHAIAVRDGATHDVPANIVLRIEMLARVRECVATCRMHDLENDMPMCKYGQAYLQVADGHFSEAATTLTTLLKKYHDAALSNLLTSAQAGLARTNSPAAEK